jgi:hypothetical protein
MKNKARIKSNLIRALYDYYAGYGFRRERKEEGKRKKEMRW